MQKTLEKAILGLDVLIDDPGVLTPNADSPKLAETLYIPRGYNNRIMDFRHEDNDRGDASRILIDSLYRLMSRNDKGSDPFRCPLANGTTLIITDVDAMPNPHSSSNQAVELAKQLNPPPQEDDAVPILTSRSKLKNLAAQEHQKVQDFHPYTYDGRRKIKLPADVASLWYGGKGISLKDWCEYFDSNAPSPNEYIEFEPEISCETDRSFDVQNIGRFSLDRRTGVGVIRPLAFTHPGHKAYKRIYPKTAAQAMMFDAILAPVSEIPIVVIPGTFGTGKTFVTLAAGLSEIELGTYEKFFLVNSRSFIGEDFGTLPGDLFEKIAVYGTSTINALSNVLEYRDCDKPGLKEQKDQKEQKGQKQSQDDSGLGQLRRNLPIDLNPLTAYYLERYFDFVPLKVIKGLSIKNNIMYCDEAQDLTRDQVREFITRIGDNTKVILSGDPKQSDFERRGASGLDSCLRWVEKKDYAAVIHPYPHEVCRSSAARRIAEDIAGF